MIIYKIRKLGGKKKLYSTPGLRTSRNHWSRPLKSEGKDCDKVADGTWQGLPVKNIDCGWRIIPSVWEQPKLSVLQAFHVPRLGTLTGQSQQRNPLPKIPTWGGGGRTLDLGAHVFRVVQVPHGYATWAQMWFLQFERVSKNLMVCVSFHLRVETLSLNEVLHCALPQACPINSHTFMTRVYSCNCHYIYIFIIMTMQKVCLN